MRKRMGLLLIAVFLTGWSCVDLTLKKGVDTLTGVWKREGTRVLINLNTGTTSTVNVTEILSFRADGTLLFSELNKETSVTENYEGVFTVYANTIIDIPNYSGVLMLSLPDAPGFEKDRGFYFSFIEERATLQLLDSKEEGALPYIFKRDTEVPSVEE